MSNDDEMRLTSGFTVEERKNFRAKLDKFASQAASDYGHPLEAVVQEIRYWQQSTSQGRTNPNEREKRASFSHWKQVCMVCGEQIESLTVATFHHIKRACQASTIQRTCVLSIATSTRAVTRSSTERRQEH
ncbi:MAG TPA: hypothetical protein VH988_33650 [Thermoanaerobaculia bacterium]|jgi:hypothetical protein|nr:hypothetical protein [Thermoanaerobaculia bacterium]